MNGWISERTFIGVKRTNCMLAKSPQLCPALCAPMDLSRQEYCSGLPYPPPGDLSDPGLEPKFLMPPALAGGFLTASATSKALKELSH